MKRPPTSFINFFFLIFLFVLDIRRTDFMWPYAVVKDWKGVQNKRVEVYQK